MNSEVRAGARFSRVSSHVSRRGVIYFFQIAQKTKEREGETYISKRGRLRLFAELNAGIILFTTYTSRGFRFRARMLRFDDSISCLK